MNTTDKRDIVEEIRSKLDIVDVINESIPLHKCGDEYAGAISSTSKSGESLRVNQRKQQYYDFAGHAGGGDVFKWIAYTEGLDNAHDFPHIIRIAADKAGVVLNHDDIRETKERGELFTFNRAVVGYYHSQLNDELREYIHAEWSISDDMIDELMIGWAPENCRLQNEMQDIFPVELMAKSGFFKITVSGELTDHYRGRIIFPYWKNGNVCYTIGRDPKWTKGMRRGKYIKQLAHSEKYSYISEFVTNSVLYGEDSARRSEIVYITEGVTDCIRLLQEGLPAISPVTTKFRRNDEEKIVKICKNKKLVRIINDNEENESGLNGAMQTAEVLESEGVKTEIVELPRPDGVDKIDVAEYLKDHTKEDIESLPGERVWHKKLHRREKPEAYIDRIEAAHGFIHEELGLMPEHLRNAFAKNDVKDYFGIKVSEVNTALKSFKSNGNGHFDPEGKFVPAKLSEEVRAEYHFATMSDIDEVKVYNGQRGFYEPNGENLIKEYTQSTLGDSSRKRHIDEVVFHVKNCTRIDREEFDKEDGHINLNNGVYNIYTGEFEEHSPAHRFTYALPFNYNPKATCREFDAYLDKIGLSDKKKLIYEIFGYCLVPGYPIQALFIWEGDGGNGKGTVSRVLQKFLGPDNYTGPSMQALEKNPYAMSGLYGKLALICGDNSSKTVMDTAPLKTLSGGDTVTAQVIYKGNIEFVNRAKLIFLMNHVPEFNDNTDSWMRRIIPIRFGVNVKGMDACFDENILSTDEELSGIFNKAMEALPDLLKRGEFSFNMSSNDVRDYLMERSNPIATFADECGFLSIDSVVPKGDVYAAYIKWCRENGITRVVQRTFKKMFKDEYRGDIKETRPYIDNKRTMCFSGYELKSEWANLNLTEEIELYEASRESGQDKTSVGQDTVRINKSDFSDTGYGNGDNGQDSSVIFNEKKDNSHNRSEEKKTDIQKRMGESNPTILTKTQKHESCEAFGKKSILTNILTKDQTNLTKIRELLIFHASGEKYNGIVNSSGLQKFVFEFKSTYPDETQGYTYKNIEEIAAKVFRTTPRNSKKLEMKQHKCVDCGSTEARHKSESIGGKITFRCDKCYDKYVYRSAKTPSNVDTVEVIS